MMNGKEQKTPILIDINATDGDLNAVIGISNLIQSIQNPLYILLSGRINALTSIIFFAVKKKNRFAFQASDMEIYTIQQLPFTYSMEVVEANLYVYDCLSKNTSINKDDLDIMFSEQEKNKLFYDLEKIEELGDVTIINTLAELNDKISLNLIK